MKTKILLAVAFSLVSGVAFAENNDKEADEAIAAFKKAYASKDESARIEAVEGLASTQNKKVVEALSGPLTRDAAPSVKRAAAKVIGQQWSQNAATTLLKALNPDDPNKDVTTAIVNALGETQSDQAVPALVSLLAVKRKGQQDNDASAFTSPALDALKKIGSARAAEDLIGFLNRESAAQGGGKKRGGGGGKGFTDPLSKEAEAALTSITGQHISNPAEWRKWWNENKDTLKVIPVYRCTGTGKTFDRPDSKTKCPHDGDQHSSCGYLLKTRFEGGGLGVPDSGSSDQKKSGRGNKNKPSN